MNAKILTLVGTMAALLAGPALAHHSFAMFDAAKTVKLAGTVKEFEWINPHTWIHLTVVDAAGKTQQWSFEGGSTGQLSQSGWTRETLKGGEKITLGFHPLKDGSFGGQLLDITFADGRSLCQGAACRAAAGGGRAGGGGE